MIALLDYDSGNIRSVEKALRKAGAEVVRTRTPEALAGAQGIVLPGVGDITGRDAIGFWTQSRKTTVKWTARQNNWMS